jgi:hypothetical protein
MPPKTRNAAASATAATVVVADANEAQLETLVTAAQSAYAALRELDEDDLPPEKHQDYWRNRYLARTAMEEAENAQFAALVDAQKAQLPDVAKAYEKLAADIAGAANAIAIVQAVSAGIGVVARVVALFA